MFWHPKLIESQFKNSHDIFGFWLNLMIIGFCHDKRRKKPGLNSLFNGSVEVY